MSKLKPIILALGLSLAVAACGGGGGPVPQNTFYRLQVAAPAASGAAAILPGILEVDRFVVEGLTAGRAIVYSDSAKPQELHEYHYHLWTEPPATMLRDELVNFLRAGKAAAQVVTPEVRVSPDYMVRGRILRLERVVGGTPGALVELEMSARKIRGDELLLLKTYKAQVVPSGDAVGEVATAFGKALTDVYGRFLGDLAAAKR
ncbi:MAG: PqiC family protein [Magnetospirillum sp. WYHS-4]